MSIEPPEMAIDDTLSSNCCVTTDGVGPVQSISTSPEQCISSASKSNNAVEIDNDCKVPRTKTRRKRVKTDMKTAVQDLKMKLRCSICQKIMGVKASKMTCSKCYIVSVHNKCLQKAAATKSAVTTFLCENCIKTKQT